jgi:hypothetical protein
MAIRINHLPAGFVIPAQPVKARKPLVGTDWVHEIKHCCAPAERTIREFLKTKHPPPAL